MKRKTARGLFVMASILALASVGFSQVEGGAIAAVDEPSEGGGGATAAVPGKRTTGGKTPVRKTTAAPAARRALTVRPVQRAPRPWNGFVVGDEYTFMNFEVISAEKPYYAREAKASGASGLVQVEILIETDGRVIKARARTGNKLLHPEAERAALSSRFPAYKFGGKPARAIGFLVYRFGSREGSRKPRPCMQDSNGFKSPLRQWTPKPFNSAEWLAGDRWVRARMRQDIFNNKIPNGKSRQEIVQMFGEANGKQTIEGREVWFYNINTGEIDDIDLLAISFDAAGRAYAGLSQNRSLSMGAICGKVFPYDWDNG